MSCSPPCGVVTVMVTFSAPGAVKATRFKDVLAVSPLLSSVIMISAVEDTSSGSLGLNA